MSKTLNYIDLFSGCGGLSLGIQNSGFKLAFAIERSKTAAETFYHNFINPIKSKKQWDDYYKKSDKEQLDEGLLIGDASSLLKNTSLLKSVKEKIGEVNLIAGGPPHQGFSLKGKKNQLPWRFLEYIEFFKPKAILIENVPVSLRKHSKRSVPIFDQIKEVLEDGLGEGNEKVKYEVQELELNALHYGVPQNKNMIFLVGIRKDITIKKNIHADKEVWKSKDYYNNPSVNKFCPIPTMGKDEYFTVKDAISDLFDIPMNNKKYLTFLNRDSGFSQIVKNNNKKLKDHILLEHKGDALARFKLYQHFALYGITANLFRLGDAYIKTEELECLELIKKEIKDICYPAIASDGTLLAKNEESLIYSICEVRPNEHIQILLKLNEPSPPLSSNDDNFIHPFNPRTTTVREQARLHSFPDQFEFRPEEATSGWKRKIEALKYTQVANAVPPLMAKAIAECIYRLLEEQ